MKINQKKKKFHLNFKMNANSDILITLATLFVLIYGSAFVVSVSMGSATINWKAVVIAILKEALFGVSGYLFMAQFSKMFRFKWLKRKPMSWFLLSSPIILLSCLAFPAAGGAHGWWRFNLGFMKFTVQPAEFVKLICILVIATYFGDNHRKYEKGVEMWLFPVVIISIDILIVFVVQHDFGTSLVMLLICAFCCMIPRNEYLKYIRYIAIGGVILFFVAMFFAIDTSIGESILNSLPDNYQVRRFTAAINPFTNRYSSSYQLVNGLIAFATGGWTGVGYAKSVRKYSDFPAASTDSILAIIVEESGFIGFMILFVAYSFIILRLLYYAKKIRSEKGKIVLVGVAMYFLIHMFFNIGGVTCSLPLTGIPFLLISAGGSSTWCAMISLGIAQGVIASYRRGDIQ